MGCFVTPAGAYYEGDRAAPADIEVPRRPSPVHVWGDGAWIEAAPSAEDANAAVQAQLDVLDARSVRPLRAILAAQLAGVAPDPADVAMLSGLRDQAATLRGRLIKVS